MKLFRMDSRVLRSNSVGHIGSQSTASIVRLAEDEPPSTLQTSDNDKRQRF